MTADGSAATVPLARSGKLAPGRYHLLCTAGDLADSVTFTVVDEPTRREIEDALDALARGVAEPDLGALAKAAVLARPTSSAMRWPR
ncbi:MAG: hypothetical protein Fur0037_14350 [Planctomycetota bacterium]